MSINAATKNDPQFKALVAVLGSQAKAKVAFDRLPKAEIKGDPRIQELVAAGFSEEDAKAALTEAPAEAAAEPTKKEQDAALVEKAGYTFTKGRVYTGVEHAEAIVRVHRTGKTEIVQSSGVGRTKAVLVAKEESGDIALQNLTVTA